MKRVVGRGAAKNVNERHLHGLLVSPQLMFPAHKAFEATSGEHDDKLCLASV